MQRDERLGSLFRGSSSFSIRSFLACSLVFIDVENLGVARSSFLVLPDERVPKSVE